MFAHIYGKSDQCQVVTFASQFSQHLTFKQSRRDDDYIHLCNLQRNLLWIMRLAVVKSLSFKSANYAIGYIDAEFSGIKCGSIPHRYSAF